MKNTITENMKTLVIFSELFMKTFLTDIMKKYFRRSKS